MNKTIKYLLLLSVVIMAFAVGFRVGGAKGYDAGYTEGYRFDCKAEISDLYSVVKEQKKAVEFVEKRIDNLTRENDSLKRPGEYDAARAKFAEDSSVYHLAARKKNDSLVKALHLPYKNLIQDDGRANLGLCMLDSRLKDLPECKPGWRVDK